ncbi:MAG: integration host factor subunit alpha [Desulfatiglandaceae bacterium]
MTLTKAQLIDSIYRRIDLPKSQAAKVIEALLEVAKKTLEEGEDVLISGFGKFCVKEKDARRGRNPQTGDDLTLESRRVVTFKCSGALKNKINRKT